MKYFTIQEFTRSTTATRYGYKNEPSAAHRRNIVEFVETLLDPLREAWAKLCAAEHYGTPQLRVSSGYRGWALNAAIGGAKSSAHCVGFAVDLVPMNEHLREFKVFCREWLADKAFDQMISEYENNKGVPRWIHIGYKDQQGGQRRQLFSMVGGKYKPMTA